MISQETKDKWDDKIKTIWEAWKRNILFLYPEEPKFLKSITKKRRLNETISIRESKWLNRIFEKIE